MLQSQGFSRERRQGVRPKKGCRDGYTFRVYDKNLPRIGLRSIVRQITWRDVDHVVVAVKYPFRDGVIAIKSKHLYVWKKNPDTKFTLIRALPANPGSQKIRSRIE
jgi:hypothetical protein